MTQHIFMASLQHRLGVLTRLLKSTFGPTLLLLLIVGNAKAEAPITALALAPGGQHVVLGSQSGIDIRSLPDLKVMGQLATKLEHVHDLVFSSDGRKLLAAGGSPAQSGRVEVWDWSKRENILQVSDHEDVVYRVAWSLDGSRFAAFGGDGLCQLFSSATGKIEVRYEGHSRAVLVGCFLDERMVASAGIDQTIRIWDGFEGDQLRTLDNHLAPVNDIALRPVRDNQQPDVLASISEDRTVRLWQPKIGRLMRFCRLVSVPRKLIWSSDGTRLIVGCNDGFIRVIQSEAMEIDHEADGQVGRIYELAIISTEELLVAGEKGCRIVTFQTR